MSKWTPGPWSVNPTGDIGPWHVGSYEYGPVCDCTDTITGDLVANARLIAAAPELLASLESTICYACDVPIGEDAPKDMNPCHVCAGARAAVAKARGEAL